MLRMNADPFSGYGPLRMAQQHQARLRQIAAEARLARQVRAAQGATGGLRRLWMAVSRCITRPAASATLDSRHTPMVLSPDQR